MDNRLKETNIVQSLEAACGMSNGKKLLRTLGGETTHHIVDLFFQELTHKIERRN